MGYYTDYTLSVYSGTRDESGKINMSDTIPAPVEQLVDAEIQRMNIFSEGNIEDSYYVNGTWYDHENDMRLLSAKFPDMVFWLSGSGDNKEDLWQKFFVAGKMQECYAKIIYDDFDASKLDKKTVGDISKKKYSYQMD